MNSLLYNVGIILFSSVAIIQFMSTALGGYAKYTTTQSNCIFIAYNIYYL